MSEYSFKYLIIEDSRIDELSLLRVLCKYSDLKLLHSAKSIEEANEIIELERPDIIFTDIEMPDGSGLENSKKQRSYSPLIIFYTSHPEFALESYEISAFDYILKPITAERFEHTYRKIKEYYVLKYLPLVQMHNKAIVFQDGFIKRQLQSRDILYFQAMQDYTKVVTHSNKSYLSNRHLSKFLEETETDMFVRIHRSYAVNKLYVKEWHLNKVIGESFELPIGVTYKSQISNLF